MAHLAACGLPARIADLPRPFSAAALMGRMRRDKKVRDGRLRFVLLRAPGEVFTASDVAGGGGGGAAAGGGLRGVGHDGRERRRRRHRPRPGRADRRRPPAGLHAGRRASGAGGRRGVGADQPDARPLHHPRRDPGLAPRRPPFLRQQPSGRGALLAGDGALRRADALAGPLRAGHAGRRAAPGAARRPLRRRAAQGLAAGGGQLQRLHGERPPDGDRPRRLAARPWHPARLPGRPRHRFLRRLVGPRRHGPGIRRRRGDGRLPRDRPSGRGGRHGQHGGHVGEAAGARGGVRDERRAATERHGA